MSDQPKETRREYSMRRERDLRAKLLRVERANRRAKNAAWRSWSRARTQLESVLAVAEGLKNEGVATLIRKTITTLEASVDLLGPAEPEQPQKEKTDDEEVREAQG